MTTPVSRDELSEFGLTTGQRETLDDDGYVVLPDVLSAEECDLWSAAVDAAWEREQSAPPPDEYRKEQGVQFVPNLLRHSVRYERFVADPRVLKAVRTVLGPEIVLHLLSARRADPGHGQQSLHELDRKRGRPFHVCNTIWCLDAFTADNGSTRVLPGSHLADTAYLDRMKDPVSCHPDERNIVAPRGAVVIFNAQLIHGGSTNRSAQPRRSVHSYFSLLNVPSQYNWRDLPPDIQAGLGAESRELLGLGTTPTAAP